MEILKIKNNKPHKAAATTLETKNSKEERKREEQIKTRRLGNIRFIAELYKKHLLTARDLHECTQELLAVEDDDAIECFCVLFTTAGKELDEETQESLSNGTADGITDLSGYFELLDKGDCCGRKVKTRIQNLITLKQNGWEIL